MRLSISERVPCLCVVCVICLVTCCSVRVMLLCSDEEVVICCCCRLMADTLRSPRPGETAAIRPEGPKSYAGDSILTNSLACRHSHSHGWLTITTTTIDEDKKIINLSNTERNTEHNIIKLLHGLSTRFPKKKKKYNILFVKFSNFVLINILSDSPWW